MLLFSMMALTGGLQSLYGQAKLVETIQQKGDEVIIPYQKYQLDNGLTLLIHEDHSDPIVHVDVTYHVGSAREEIGKSGFAHFFEHMMFQGSDNVADEEHFKIITEAGGTLNGTTNRDRTNYFETVPANQLEKMLWLEADRMGFLLDAVTQKKFEVQRATVKNERGQRYDNQPYGLAREYAAKNLYPYGHPYSWLTIGYIEDLNRVDVNDLKNFFLRWYGPNNAVLTVGGDVNPKQVVAWVEKYFGSIPRGPEVTPANYPLPVLKQDRYVSFVDNYAKLPMLQMYYPSPKRFEKDEVALDCLMEILGQGKSSILYKNLVKSNKAVNVSAYNYASELAGEITFSVIPYPGQNLSDIEKTIRTSLEEFEKRGVSDEDIERFIGKAEADMVYGLESVNGKVSQLAAYYTFTGDANYLKKDLHRYTSLTKEDVIKAYHKYIKGQSAVILSVLTKDHPENKAGEDNYTVDESNYQAPDYGYKNLSYNKGKDNFDRSQQPPAAHDIVVTTPSIWEADLFNNNASVIGTESKELPVVNLLIKISGGRLMDPKGKEGTASLFTDLMNEGTEKYTAGEIEEQLKAMGSSIRIGTGLDYTSIQVRSLTKNLDATLALLEERLFHPKFTEEDFARVKKQAIESLKHSSNRPAYIASKVFNKLIFGPEHPLGHSTDGTEASLDKISLADIQSYYQNNIGLSGLKIVVVGDISQESILQKLGFLGKLPNGAGSLPAFPDIPRATPNTVYFVDVPGAAQSEFRMGFNTDLLYDATGDFYRATVMNFPLGGAFNSRLNLYLREDKGWTYGARSAFNGNQYMGTYSFQSGIKANATDSALVAILEILKNFKEKGMSAEELNFTRHSITLSEARKYETGFQKANFLGRIQTYHLDKDFTEQQNKLLSKMTLPEAKALGQKHLPDQEDLVILIVGDKASLAPTIEAKGFKVVEVDKDANKL